MLKSPKTRYVTLGALAFFLFGAGLFVVGGRLIAYQYLLSTQGRTTTGTITEAGTVRRSSGGYVNFIRYRFEDTNGNVHSGQSSGYSGATGETIRLEYARSFPFIHRLSGEGKKTGYKWRWVFCGAGLVFAVAGMHWFVSTIRRTRLGKRLAETGKPATGTIKKIDDNGRTIVYEYQVGPGLHHGKSLALPLALTRNYTAGDSVEVLYDPAVPHSSILKLEL